MKATAAMALNLPLDTVAENVDMRKQLNLLKEWGCDSAQRYYFNKPYTR